MYEAYSRDHLNQPLTRQIFLSSLINIVTITGYIHQGNTTRSTRSTGSSTLSAKYLERTIEKLKCSKYAPATRKTYHHAWQSFNDFFIKLDVKPYNWEDRLALFLAYLIDRQQPEQTIQSYVSGIKSVLHDDGVERQQFIFVGIFIEGF